MIYEEFHILNEYWHVLIIQTLSQVIGQFLCVNSSHILYDPNNHIQNITNNNVFYGMLVEQLPILNCLDGQISNVAVWNFCFTIAWTQNW